MTDDAHALPESVLVEIYDHARATYPEECCGYVVGRGSAATVVRCTNRQNELHEHKQPKPNDSGGPRREEGC